jgi:hypothetical protein
MTPVFCRNQQYHLFTRFFHFRALPSHKIRPKLPFGWMECYGDRYESFLFVVEQKDIIKQLKKPQEYIIFDPLSLEKLFKGNSKLWKS